MKRAKGKAWEETQRREIGVVTGDAPPAGATFTLLYQVTERRNVGGAVEWRERVVRGATLYQHPQPLVATTALLEMVASGVKALSHIARMEDERSAAAKRATSRRKAR